LAAAPIDAAARQFLLKAQYRSRTESYRRDYPAARREVVEHFGGRSAGRHRRRREPRPLRRHRAHAPGAGPRAGDAPETLALDEPLRLGLPAQVSVLTDNISSLKLCARLGFARLGESPPFVRLERRPRSAPLACRARASRS
jgi:hypothetical protein